VRASDVTVTSSPYVEMDRDTWVRLSESTPLPLTDEDVTRLRGLGDPIDLAEVDAIYRPLSRRGCCAS
jgi:type I pantothenate kinase